MTVGSFTVVILDGDDKPIASVERTTRGGRPTVGEEILLEGRLYVVERVCHEDEREDRTVRRYVEPRLYVREARAARRRRKPVKALSLGKP